MSKRSKTIGTDPAQSGSPSGTRPGTGSHSLSASSLPVRRSFVVQFQRCSSLDRASFEGRIEHIVSGTSTQFAGGAELLEQLEAALLGDAEGDSPGTACS